MRRAIGFLPRVLIFAILGALIGLSGLFPLLIVSEPPAIDPWIRYVRFRETADSGIASTTAHLESDGSKVSRRILFGRLRSPLTGV